MKAKLPKGRRVRLTACTPFPSSAASRPPNPTLAQLRQQADTLVLSALEASTRRSYQQQVDKHWLPFLQMYNLDAKPTADTILLFIAWCGNRIQGVDKVLSAVRWHYKLSNAEWESLRMSMEVKSALIGLKKLNPKPPKRAPPLLPAHVAAFAARALARNATYNDLLAAVLATVGFGAMMRLGELVLPTRPAERDPRKYIRRDSVEVLSDSAVSFFLPYHKADRLWHGSHVTLVSANSIPDFDFVLLFRLYLRRRDALAVTSPFLFICSDGVPPSRHFFTSRLAALAPGHTGHSLRAGGATYLASLGVRPEIIKRIGRWSSNTWEIYLRDNPAVAASVNRVDLQ